MQIDTTKSVSIHTTSASYAHIRKALKLLGYTACTAMAEFDPEYPYLQLNVAKKEINYHTRKPEEQSFDNLSDFLRATNKGISVKPGDKVVRLITNSAFVDGKVYVVADARGDDISIEHPVGGWWFRCYFAKVESVESNGERETIEAAIADKYKELDQLQDQLNKTLINQAGAAGFVVGAKIRTSELNSYTINELHVCTKDNYKAGSIRVRQYWDRTTKPFVFASCRDAYGNLCSIPVPDATLLKHTAPIIHGFTMSKYTKGDTFVVFGCAQIDIEFLKAIRKNNQKTDCRKAQTITLCSGKPLTAQDVDDILNYIGE